MRTRGLGRSGMDVSVVGLGCNNFGRRADEDASRAVIDAALDAGVTFFDTADVYGDGASEEIIGRALEGRRDGVVLATKFGGRGSVAAGRGSRESVRQALEGSLKRLRTDWIDLYQHHREDPETPLAETIGALTAQPVIASVIAGATKPQQVRTNADAASWEPTERELDAILGSQPAR